MTAEGRRWRQGSTGLFVLLIGGLLLLLVLCMVPCLFFGWVGETVSTGLEDAVLHGVEDELERRGRCQALAQGLPPAGSEPVAIVRIDGAPGAEALLVATNLANSTLIDVDVLDSSATVIFAAPAQRVEERCVVVRGIGAIGGPHRVHVRSSDDQSSLSPSALRLDQTFDVVFPEL